MLSRATSTQEMVATDAKILPLTLEHSALLVHSALLARPSIASFRKVGVTVMNTMERGVLYVISFLFFPFGFLVWLLSLVSQDPHMQKNGRIAFYIALVSVGVFIFIGVANFI